MNSEEIKYIDEKIPNSVLNKLAKVLTRLNKMIDKLNNSNQTQEHLKSLLKYNKNKYEEEINQALKTLKKLISQKLKENNNLQETRQNQHKSKAPNRRKNSTPD